MSSGINLYSGLINIDLTKTSQKVLYYMNNKIDNYIEKYLSNTLLEDEKHNLFDWVNLSKNNREYFDQNIQLFESINSDKLKGSFNSNNAWLKFENKNFRRSISIKKIVNYSLKIASIIIIGLFVGLNIHEKSQDNDLLIKYIVPKGQLAQVEISDGTKIWLNSDSELEYSNNFGSSNKREIFLKGEAYLEVAHNVDKPFIVSTNGLKVEVLGTKFNVNTFGFDTTTVVTLFEGLVKVSPDNHKSKILEPGYTAVYSKSGKMVIQKTDIRKINSWIYKEFYFNNERLEDFALRFNRRYNIKINFESAELKNLRLSGEFRNETIDEIMTSLKFILSINYTIEGNEILIKKTHKKI